MHRTTALLLAAMMLIGVGAPSATAEGKKKSVEEEWDVTALPFPGADDHSNPEEECGVEGVSYTIHTFTTPGRGSLDVRINEFQGEWDLYVSDADGNLLGSSVNFMAGSEERVTIPLAANVEVSIYACNFLGGPTAHGALKYVYRT